MGICQYVVEEFVYIVVVEVVGHAECQAPVLLVDDVVAQGKLDTLVGSLTYVLELVGATCRSVDRNHHQDVLGGVPVEV